MEVVPVVRDRAWILQMQIAEALQLRARISQLEKELISRANTAGAQGLQEIEHELRSKKALLVQIDDDLAEASVALRPPERQTR